MRRRPWLTSATLLWAANGSVLFGSDHLWIPFQLWYLGIKLLWPVSQGSCPSPPLPLPHDYLSLWCVSSQLKACGNWRGGRQAGLRPFVPARLPSFNDSPEFSGPSSNSLTQHTRPWFLDHCLWNHLRQNCTSSCSSLLTVKVLIKVLGGS